MSTQLGTVGAWKARSSSPDRNIDMGEEIQLQSGTKRPTTTMTICKSILFYVVNAYHEASGDGILRQNALFLLLAAGFCM